MTTEQAHKPEVTYMGVLDMQVCVPGEWTDEQVLAFAEQGFPCGTTGGWSIRRDDQYAGDGYSERVPCAERDGCVHVMLDA